ncbi:MAG: glycosyltransferase [Mediterranea sp.]|jgi:glycosyltransferase involved in cell wall biosynthesis|nr:glycosyltransferase [Mediterranea sp.]
MTKLSIITVNLNNKEGLQQTIESVITQTFPDFEYIIIDGGSTDGSVDVIKQYEDKITYWMSEPDKGIYQAMNKGILQSKGEYCQFLNSGDIFCAETVLENVFRTPYPEDMLTGNIVRIFPKKEVMERGLAYESEQRGKPLTLFDFFVNGTLPHQATFMRRKLFDQYGLYDENYRIVSDWLFFLKTVGWNGVKVKYLDLLIIRFNMLGISNTQIDLRAKERALAAKTVVPPSILADYEYFTKIENHFHRVFQHKITYQWMRCINKAITVYEILTRKI